MGLEVLGVLPRDAGIEIPRVISVWCPPQNVRRLLRR